MLGIFQNRIYFAIMILVTTIIAAGIAYRGLDLGYSPRTYAEIIATPTPTRGPETPTRVIRTIPTPTRTVTPSLPPTPNLALPMAFADDFSDSKNFALIPNVQARVTITNHTLLMHFVQPTTAYLLSKNTQARGKDFAVQVDGRAVTSPSIEYGFQYFRVEYGLLFWHGVDSNGPAEEFVYLLVNSGGSFRVVARNSAKGEIEIVPRTVSTAIRLESIANTLRVDARGSRLTVSMNGSIVADVVSDTLAEFRKGLVEDGKVGLIGYASVGNLDVQFSNFRLYAQP